MGFGSSSIETTSSWSLWKTMKEFIEKARRAAVVDGGLLRSASPGRDQQTQAEIQPSTTTYHAQKGEQRRKMKRRERKKSWKKKKKNLNRRVRNDF